MSGIYTDKEFTEMTLDAAKNQLVTIIYLSDYQENSFAYKVHSILRKLYKVDIIAIEDTIRLSVWKIPEGFHGEGKKQYLEGIEIFGKDIVNCLLNNDWEHPISNKGGYIQDYCYGNNHNYSEQQLKITGRKNENVLVLQQLGLHLECKSSLLDEE